MLFSNGDFKSPNRVPDVIFRKIIPSLLDVHFSTRIFSILVLKTGDPKIKDSNHPSYLGARAPMEETDIYFDVTVEIITEAPRD